MFDLIRLADNKGNEYKALVWEGDPPGGHHREGLLKFSPVTPRPAYIEINVKPVGDGGNYFTMEYMKAQKANKEYLKIIKRSPLAI